jgi:molybdopterin converting factor small subunit
MQLTVKLYGTLRKYRPESASGAPHHPFDLSIPENSTINDLARYLKIVDGAVNAAAVNGDAVGNETVLRDGDAVSLFPPSAGGAG